MTISEIDIQAANGNEMPNNLNTAQQRLYQTLRCIYFQYKCGWIDKEEGRREKQKAISAYEVDEIHIKANADAIKIRSKVAGMLNDKSECDVCRKVARVLDGRDKSDL